MLVGLIMCLLLLKSGRKSFYKIYIYINAEFKFLDSPKHFVILISIQRVSCGAAVKIFMSK